jgi:hypothetical protein
VLKLPFGRFLQQKRNMQRRYDETMSTLKNNKQKRINAAAAPDAIEVSARAWPLRTAPAEAEKKVNGDFVLRPKLMNNPVIIGTNTAGLKSVKIKNIPLAGLITVP